MNARWEMCFRQSRVVLALTAISLTVLVGMGCQKPPAAAKNSPASLETITLCRSTTMLLSLVVAEQQGFFAEQGLRIAAKEFAVGREAMEGMLRGDCDLATAAEPPMVEYALQREDFRILAALQSSDNLSRIAARGDRGIATPADLKGKRVATVKGTAPHYFLKIFLEREGIELNEITLEFRKGEELLPALAAGQVEAIAMTNRVIVQTQQTLPAAVIMEAPGLTRNYYMLLATLSFLEKRPAAAIKFFRALVRAEAFIQQNPKAAQAIATAYQQVSPAELAQLWGMYDHRISLDHAMVMGLEDTARWYIQQSDNRQQPIPNFKKFIYTRSLRTVKPDAIELAE